MGPRQPCHSYNNVSRQLAIEQQTITEFDPLPRTTERSGRESGDEPRTNSVEEGKIIPYRALLQRGKMFRACPEASAPKART